MGFEPTCPVKDNCISSAARYDRFDNSPCHSKNISSQRTYVISRWKELQLLYCFQNYKSISFAGIYQEIFIKQTLSVLIFCANPSCRRFMQKAILPTVNCLQGLIRKCLVNDVAIRILLLFTAWEPLIVTIRSDIPSFASQKSPLTPASCSHGMRNRCAFLTRE